MSWISSLLAGFQVTFIGRIWVTTEGRFSSLLVMPPLCGPSARSSRWIPQTLTFNLEGQTFKSNVLSFPKDYGRLHPTQKPVALFEYLIRTYTNPGELVLDNCIGSGTTAIACINTDRQYIGFELDPEYFKAAEDRIQRHMKPVLEVPVESTANVDCLFDASEDVVGDRRIIATQTI